MSRSYTVLPKVDDDGETLPTRSALVFWFGMSAAAWTALLVLLI